jgi:ribosomal protein S17
MVDLKKIKIKEEEFDVEVRDYIFIETIRELSKSIEALRLASLR